jgi:hypothetical protein
MNHTRGNLLGSHAHTDLRPWFESSSWSEHLDIRRLECWSSAYGLKDGPHQAYDNRLGTRSIRGILLHRMVNQVVHASCQLVSTSKKNLTHNNEVPFHVSLHRYKNA